MNLELIKTELEKYAIADAAIAELHELYMPLKINGIADKKGALVVYKARRDVATKRCDIEAKRKELKADSLAYGKAVDSEAKRLTDNLLVIENHLKQEEQKVEDERIKIEAERLNARLDLIGGLFPYTRYTWAQIIKDMDDEKFESELAKARIGHETEQKRLAEIEKEKTKQEEEKEILRKEAVAQEATRLFLVAENEKMRKQKEELKALERELMLDRQRDEATQINTKADALRAKLEELIDEVDRNEQRPKVPEHTGSVWREDDDIDKMRVFAAQIESLIPPIVVSNTAKKRVLFAMDSLSDIGQYLREDF